MFAYVYFLDDRVKDSVNVKDIKHFDPKNTTDFSSTQTYWILQKGRFTSGQILFMKETCEEIEQFLATGKRIRVPKLLDKIPPENNTSERKEAKDNAVGNMKRLINVIKKKYFKIFHFNLHFQTAQKTSIEEGRQTFLMDILKKRQALKRKQPLCPPHSTTKREKLIVDDEISSESEDELIQKSKFDELEKRYKLLSRKYQEAIAEGKELRKLNVELQTCLVAKILCGNNTSPGSIKALPVTTENSFEQISEKHEVDIGEGVFVHSGKWKKIQDNIKDSLFVKEMAVCIWGTSTLANRSLEGKSCPTTKSDPRPPLTPHKFRALKCCFQKWLKGKNLDEGELKARAGKLGHYITEKIQDINKKLKPKK
nr:BEN domain-containing protein 5-like isoform X2 [Paramormyrops kingsleyae]